MYPHVTRCIINLVFQKSRSMIRCNGWQYVNHQADFYDSRPYSVSLNHNLTCLYLNPQLCQAIEISTNLHQKVTKCKSSPHFLRYCLSKYDLAYTIKALKELHEQNLVAGKTAGRLDKLLFSSLNHNGCIQGNKLSIMPFKTSKMRQVQKNL